MKTKLLLLLLLATSFANAQVTFSESFESAGMPTGWTFNGFSETTNIPCAGSTSITAIFNALAANYEHSVHTPNYVTNGDNINFSFDYRFLVTNPDFGVNAFVDVYYAINNGSFNLIQTFGSSTITCATYSTVLLGSSVPAGSNVKFAVGVRRSGGYFLASLDNFVATSTAPTVPAITSISSTVTADSATINYSLNGNNQATSSVVKYGFSASDLSNQEIGFSVTGNSITPGSVLLSGLSPDTVYFYSVEATNSFGTTTNEVLNFRTNTLPQLISEYKFNNSVYNEANDSNFSAPSVTDHLYTIDRFGIENNALFTSSSTLYRDDIVNLPTQNNSRTISLWIRPTAVNSDNIVFTYGSPSGSNVYGASFNASNIYNFTYSSNLAYATATTINNWKHIVYTFDKATSVAKIYVNGVLGNQGTYLSWSTAVNNNFYLGNSFGSATGAFSGAIDDLKFYNYVITDADVTTLYTSNMLASQNFNQNNLKVSLHPNPATDILNIELANEVKSVEIYSLQGQKVMATTQKQVNVSSLSKGIYLVKVTDAEDNAASQKVIIE